MNEKQNNENSSNKKIDNTLNHINFYSNAKKMRSQSLHQKKCKLNKINKLIIQIKFMNKLWFRGKP